MEGVRHVYSVDLLSVVEQGSLSFETSVSYSPLILHEFTVSAGKVMEAFQGFAMGGRGGGVSLRIWELGRCLYLLLRHGT